MVLKADSSNLCVLPSCDAIAGSAEMISGDRDR
jgi:hypothetical protein